MFFQNKVQYNCAKKFICFLMEFSKENQQVNIFWKENDFAHIPRKSGAFIKYKSVDVD